MLGFSAHPFTTSQRLLFWFAFAGTVSGASVAGSHFFLIVDSVRATSAAPPSTNTVLRDIVSTGRLADLRWPDFSDYHRHAQNFCEPASFSLAWVSDGEPTPQELTIIEVLQQADLHGFDPEDYDASR